MSAVQEVLHAATIDDVQAAILDATAPLLPRGGGSKPALSAAGTGIALDLSGLSGILEYDPGEYTFTAYAGTPLAAVRDALAENGQYLPFDPPLVDQGATLGGTVAAGLSGAGRMRYGGVRDFLIGVRFVDGRGRLVRGGGKVVKNAAGFDLPKLMVGSLGRLGILVEASFKVFPAPKAYATLAATLPGIAEAAATARKLAAAPLDLEGLDFAPTDTGGPGATLWVRLGGLQAALPARLERLQALLGQGEALTAEEDRALWSRIRALDWIQDGQTLVKVATAADQVAALDRTLAETGATRHYSVAGNLAWVAWPDAPHVLDSLLRDASLPGLVLAGAASRPLIGHQPGAVLLSRVKQTLDPAGRFPNFG
jgi:glycolate oxidase FAD binding subunit